MSKFSGDIYVELLSPQKARYGRRKEDEEEEEEWHVN